MKLTRRGFLKTAIAGMAAVSATKISSFIPLQKPKEIPKVPEMGFGLAPVKKEGGIITYGSHPKDLGPGWDKWYQTEYKECPIEYSDLFEV